MRRANEAIEQAKETLKGLAEDIKTLQTDLATYIQERDQLEKQRREAEIVVEETKYLDSISTEDNVLF